MSEGWISLNRTIRDHWLYEKRILSKFEAWVEMLMMANHQDNKFLLGNELVSLKRGQFVTSELKLMDRWGWSKTKVRNFLKLLEEDEMIIKKSDKKKTTLTICNYSLYQDKRTTERPIEDHKKTTERPQENTNNNVNNVNNVNNKDIVDYLNLACTTNFKPTGKKTISLINARINEGFSIEDFKRVINIKAKEWLNTEQAKYLRPETLFGTKFEGYLNQQPIVKQSTELAGARCANTLGTRRPNALGG